MELSQSYHMEDSDMDQDNNGLEEIMQKIQKLTKNQKNILDRKMTKKK